MKLRIKGDDIRKLRLQKVMSREDLAQASGLHRTTIEHYEVQSRKYSKPSTIRALAGALGVTPESISEVVEEQKAVN